MIPNIAGCYVVYRVRHSGVLCLDIAGCYVEFWGKHQLDPRDQGYWITFFGTERIT